jgi:phosphoenolpyruvate carboxylase
MSDEDYKSLRSNVSLLGSLLGEVVSEAEGGELFDLVERCRLASKQAREGDEAAREQLQTLVAQLSDDQLVPVARAFSQFLNLANLAEQQHNASREMDAVFSASETLAQTVSQLESAGIAAVDIEQAIADLNIELVLTAHPTEITRRTLIHKQAEIGECLAALELGGRTPRELQRIHDRLRALIAQIWYSSDFRETKPTPVDEAKWGFAVVEDSLWRAVPEFLRRLDRVLRSSGKAGLPLSAAPVRFLFWMGSDRDGNPNVTAAVTREVMLLARWQAAKLYLADIDRLVDELSMAQCNAELRALAGEAREPYRQVLKQLRALLRHTLVSLEQALAGEQVAQSEILAQADQLLSPLQCCYQSLLDCGMQSIANQELLDTLRRVECFGVSLVRFDIRQESSRHTQALDEITQMLGLGSYAQWNENERLEFLVRELSQQRPLLPRDWVPSPDVAEVLATCELVAAQDPERLGAYVISMATSASDVLAVKVLLKACYCTFFMPVAPLFETLDDLERSTSVMSELLAIPVYRNALADKQMVMIGYSDSSKDAGVLAASWALYRAQEGLLALCAEQGVQLTLFHGRGGTIGRGGAPAHQALLSQPPGSLAQGLRVTEQGEMIRAKLGSTSLAVKTFALYASAICQANLLTPPVPAAQWRELMKSLAEASCDTYRGVVRGGDDFIDYFQAATPLNELSHLPLGSRPARRKSASGLAGLRAIPWIFSWMQNRLLLPAWLGFGAAVRARLEVGDEQLLREMSEQWPFFSSLLSMQGMLFEKIDADLSAHYEACLVPAELHEIGRELRAMLAADRDTLLALQPPTALSSAQRWGLESVRLRSIYTDPLNYLQVESLARMRSEDSPQLREAVMVTIAGIAAGMRNTG